MSSLRMKKAFILNGYKYHHISTKKNIQYFRCFLARKGHCKATGKLPINADNDLFELYNQHNHPRNQNLDMQAKFKEELKNMAVKSAMLPKQIFDAVSLLYPEAAVQIAYQNVESSIRNWRRQHMPSIPHTLIEYGAILGDPDWQRYGCTSQGAFFLGLVTAMDHSNAVVLGNIDFMKKILAINKNLSVDGTFKCVPQTPDCYQLLVLLGTAYGQALPMMFVLMERKTQALYRTVFQFLKNQLSEDLYPEKIMCDFEIALYSSVRQVFTQTTIQGCHFHFCQAMFRKAKALGLIRDIRGNDVGVNLIRYYLSLPLLPAASVREGFNCINDLTPEELRPMFQIFRNYVETQWLNRVGAEHFSVFNSRTRTNNNIESFNRHLNIQVGTERPAIWNLHNTLKNIFETANLNLTRLENGLQITRNQRSDQKQYEKKLFKAWEKLESGTISVTEFLVQSRHFVQNMHENFELHLMQQNDEDDILINNNEQVDEEIFHLPEDDFEGLLPDEAFEHNTENILRDEHLRWTHASEDEEEIEDLYKCIVCLSKKKRYSFECGHLYCGQCAQEIFNIQFGRCPECRRFITEQPRRVFL